MYPAFRDGEFCIWKTPAASSPDWEIAVFCRSADNGNYPLTIRIRAGKPYFYYELRYSGRFGGLSPNVYFGDVSLTYNPDGHLFEYAIAGDDITYAYRYSSSSGRIILASIRNDENDSSYWRGLNDVWFTYDSSRQQIQCGKPPEADTCPPLPVR